MAKIDAAQTVASEEDLTVDHSQGDEVTVEEDPTQDSVDAAHLDAPIVDHLADADPVAEETLDHGAEAAASADTETETDHLVEADQIAEDVHSPEEDGNVLSANVDTDHLHAKADRQVEADTDPTVEENIDQRAEDDIDHEVEAFITNNHQITEIINLKV